MLTQGLHEEPTHIKAYAQRSICHGALRNYAEGLRDAKTRCRLAPRDAAAWLQVGNLFYGMRQYDKAKDAYLTANKFSLSPEFRRKVCILYDNVSPPDCPATAGCMSVCPPRLLPASGPDVSDLCFRQIITTAASMSHALETRIRPVRSQSQSQSGDPRLPSFRNEDLPAKAAVHIPIYRRP